MKTGFWLRGGKGKLAGATVYQQSGETVMREVVTPSNPKTEKQMIQRIVMHTCMQAYSKMKEITDHSFEGQKKGRDTMAYFMQQNVQRCRDRIATMQAQGTDFYDMYNFVPLGLKGFTANEYQVAMGSMPRIYTTFDSEDARNAFVAAIKTNTYQAVIDALGLQRGDQLTFIVVDAVNASADFGQNQFHFCRIILDPTNADNSQAALSSAFLTEQNAINLPSVRNENADNFAISIDATKGLSFRMKGSTVMVAAAVIASRQQGDNWLRSTTYLTYVGNLGTSFSMGDCLDRAANGATSAIYAPSELYLNNAGVGGGAAASGSAENQGGGGESPTNNDSPTNDSPTNDGEGN